MKTSILIKWHCVALTSLSLIIPSAMAEDHDYRMVGKTVVDTQPIIEWLRAKRKGPRPMPTWKYCSVSEMLTSSLQADLCVISGEGVPPSKVYLMHLDAIIKDPFVHLIEATTRIDELNQQIRDETKIINGLRGARNSMLHSEMVAAQGRLNAANQELASVIAKKNDAIAKLGPAKAAHFLAVDTERSALIPGTGIQAEFWDCGMRVKGPPAPALPAASPYQTAK